MERRRLAYGVSINYITLCADLLSDNWGFTDAEAAVEAIPNWISTVQWEGPSVDLEKWFVSGHSNGGKYIFKGFILYVLKYRRPRSMVRAYSSSEQDNWRRPSIWLFVDSRYTIFAIRIFFINPF